MNSTTHNSEVIPFAATPAAAQAETPDETSLRELLHALRWPHLPLCPRCGAAVPSASAASASAPPPDASPKPAPDAWLYCRACRKRFNVLLGTVLQNSHLPLRVWIAAFQLACSSPEVPSAADLKRRLPLRSHRAAQRLRAAIAPFVRLARDAQAHPHSHPFHAAHHPALTALRLALNPAAPPPPPPPSRDPGASGANFVNAALATLDRLMAQIASTGPMTPSDLESRSVLITRIARGLRDVNKYVLAQSPAPKPQPVETLQMEPVTFLSREEWERQAREMLPEYFHGNAGPAPSSQTSQY